MSTDDALDRGLLSPGTAGVESVVSDDAIVRALIEVEVALAVALEETGIAPAGVAAVVREAASAPDTRALAEGAASGGNPVIPLVAALRAAVASRDADAAHWVHRGATSQDILDSALMRVAARALDDAVPRFAAAASSSAALADAHRNTLQVGRTLTQHSTPIVFGAVAAQWALGLADAASGLRRARAALPVQLGGASGNLASFVELASSCGRGADAAARLPGLLAAELGLRESLPWHVRRTPVTALGDALVTGVDAAGAVASDVAVLARPEIAEVSEGEGGGSSTMPQKQNPVRSVLIRSLAQRAPALGAELHRSAATAVDQRPDGAWHAEWPALRELLRITLGAGDLIDRLLAGLRVDPERMSRTLRDAGPAVLGERAALARGPAAAEALLRDPSGADPALLDPAGYLGLSESLIDEAIHAVRP